MVSKEVSCTISQFIYDDILDSFEAKGVFSQLSGPSLAASPRSPRVRPKREPKGTKRKSVSQR